MGNHKFRLSDMMPNSWFYKLKDMSRASRRQRTSLPNLTSRRSTATATTAMTTTTPKPYQPAKPPYLPNRPSYYFPSREQQQQESPSHPKATDTHFPLDPPRKSKRQARRKPSVPSPAILSVSGRPTTPNGHCKPTFAGLLDFESSHSCPSSCDCRLTSSATDIIIDVEQEPSKAGGDFIDFIADLERHLPPIVTKPARKEPELGGRNVRRIKVRPCSPGLGTRRFRHKTPAQRRRGLEESLVVVKKSADPQRDFWESMMEMIVENDLRASKDLEELLACYLSLNSDEYHDVIVKVFQQIWFDLSSC